MNSKKTLSYAIMAILTASAVGAARADAPAAEPSLGLEEIVVTAQRRTENLQNVPITIQALTAETLTKLNVTTFDDFVKYLPNVTAPTNGPGQGNIFMRGLSVGSAGTQSSGSIGGFPNVAIYLDDQSGQLPGRNLDIYAADLERIEVLEGPQGTLFGAGAQAGVVRYITNKPKLDVTEGAVNAGYGTTAHGNDNSNVDATLNLPLIPDTLAVRMVVYNDSRGGYINNVPSTFTRKSTDLGVQHGYDGGAVAAGNFAVANNDSLVANAINPVTYQGMRLSGLYKINEDWNVLVTQSYQNINSQGVFYQMPYGSDGAALPALSVSLFSPSYDHDKFENTSWTVNGKFGDLKAVYTGGYLVRNVDQVQDYTNYARGVYADYYQCHGSNKGTITPTCYSPVTSWREQERNTHQSHEFRLSTPDDWRLRGIVGAFWEDYEIQDQTDWLYKTLPPCTTSVTTGCMTNVAPTAGSTTTNPAIRNDNTAFFEDIQRGYKQYAFFASGDFDLIPKKLTLTVGTRYYHFTENETGTVVSSFGCYQAGPAPCATEDGTNLNGENLNSTYSGFKSRANVSFHVTDDTLLYYTWSQGFRPGGFNRTSTCHIPSAAAPGGQFCIPQFYGSDTLTNNELGWKTEFLDRRVQFNGALYQEDWKNVQTGFFDPGVTGNLTFGANGPSYRIRGLETSIIARVTQGLTLTGAASWNSSDLTESPGLPFNNPKYSSAPGYGGEIPGLSNLYGPLGSPSANSPPFQGNLRARYEWKINEYNAFAQIGGTHMGHSYTQAANQPAGAGTGVNSTLLRFENPAYSQMDASLGVAKDQWTAGLYGSNLTNTNASLFTSTAQFIESQTVLRPRVITLKFGYKF